MLFVLRTTPEPDAEVLESLEDVSYEEVRGLIDFMFSGYDEAAQDDVEKCLANHGFYYQQKVPESYHETAKKQEINRAKRQIAEAREILDKYGEYEND